FQLCQTGQRRQIRQLILAQIQTPEVDHVLQRLDIRIRQVQGTQIQLRQIGAVFRPLNGDGRHFGLYQLDLITPRVCCACGAAPTSGEITDAGNDYRRRRDGDKEGGLDFFLLRGGSGRGGAGGGGRHHLLSLDGVQGRLRALEAVLRL